MVVAIDRIGRTWQDILRSICELRDRGVKIRSLADTVANLTLVDAKAGFTGKNGSGPQHRQRSGRRDGQPRRRVARANLDTRFARVGISAQIILPNKGFPSKFLARIGYTESVPARARTRDRPAVNGKLQLSYRTICLWAEYRLRPW